MHVKHDPEGDVVYVTLRPDLEERGGRRIDGSRILHVGHDGTPVAYEFLWASRGISLDGIHPDDQRRIRRALSVAMSEGIEPSGDIFWPGVGGWAAAIVRGRTEGSGSRRWRLGND